VHGKYRATRSGNSPLDDSEFSFINGFSVFTKLRKEGRERARGERGKNFCRLHKYYRRMAGTTTRRSSRWGKTRAVTFSRAKFRELLRNYLDRSG